VKGRGGLRRALALVAVAAALLSAVAAARAGDWVGDRYGWRIRGGVDATTDGRHWRTIICCAGTALQMAHTGPTTGMVALGDEQFPPYDYFWTVDNGRHWYIFDDSGADAIAGHGSFLYWESTTKRGLELDQVRPWPPRGRALRCAGRFTPYDGVPGLFCDRTLDPLRLVRAGTTIEGVQGVGGLVDVPGGIATLALRVDASVAIPLLRLVVRRHGTTFLIPLPEIASALEQQLASYELQLVADWPFVEVVGGTRAGPVVWTSYDGARTWSVAAPS
jgi:hypothetical protein